MIEKQPQQTFDGYDTLLKGLKERIRHAQVRAALSVNKELILLYWQVGRQISEEMNRRGWGTNVVVKLSQDLRGAFPEMKGFSPRNLRYMRSFAEAYPDEKILQQLAAKIPWFHNCLLLDKIKSSDERITFSLEKSLIEKLMQLAQLEGIIYQPPVRQVLTRYVSENEHRLELPMKQVKKYNKAI